MSGRSKIDLEDVEDVASTSGMPDRRDG